MILFRYKNWEHIISKMCTRGKMNLKESKINFAVPNERYLCHTDKNMEKIIPPGVIKEACEILKKLTKCNDFKRHQKNFMRTWQKSLWRYQFMGI